MCWDDSWGHGQKCQVQAKKKSSKEIRPFFFLNGFRGPLTNNGGDVALEEIKNFEHQAKEPHLILLAIGSNGRFFRTKEC